MFISDTFLLLLIHKYCERVRLKTIAIVFSIFEPKNFVKQLNGVFFMVSLLHGQL